MAPVERLTTTAMANDGRAVARRSTGQVVFVTGALPGETVDVRIESDRARYAAGTVVAVISPSTDRVGEPCPRRHEGCGGCQWQHVSPGAQRLLKVGMIEEALVRIGRVNDFLVAPTVELEPWHWRTTIQAGVVDGEAALRRAGSHDLVPIDGCLIAHPLLSPLLSGRRYGKASAVLLRCGARTGDVLVAPEPRHVAVDVPPGVRRDFFYEEAAGRRWRVSGDSFFQSRPDGADALAQLVGTAVAEVGSSGPAVDLFSGVGLFAGVLADRGWAVTAVEGSRPAVEDARVNLDGAAVEVVKADVTRWKPVPARVVVADPSRAGLGAAGVSVLIATGASRVILISCDVGSLGRDAGLLTRAGYQLASVTPVDLFPHTWRSEVVSVFDRQS